MKPIKAIAFGEKEIFITNYSSVENKDGKIKVLVDGKYITIYESDEELTDTVYQMLCEAYCNDECDCIDMLSISVYCQQ